MDSSDDYSISNMLLELNLTIDRQDCEYLQSNLTKLEELKELCFEKSLDKKLLQKCLESLHVEIFLYNQVFAPKSQLKINNLNFISKNRSYIKHLLQEKEAINEVANEISKENRQIEKQIIKKKQQLKDFIERRRKLMNEVIRLYGFLSGKLMRLNHSDISDLSISKGGFKHLTVWMAAKSSRIVMLSRVLHNLICFSGKLWATDKNLLEIVLCSGDILGRSFSAENRHEFKKIIDNTIHKLNCVKI